MEELKGSKYLFQAKKRSLARKLFESGLNAKSYILLNLRQEGEVFLKDFLDSLPNSYPGFKILKEMFGYDAKKASLRKEIIKINFDRLKKQGLVDEDQKRGICFLTEKGKEFASYIFDRYSILGKPWDGKIRIVIFDIPEKKKYLREWFRGELILLQFKPIQKSVYAGKYPLPKSFCQEIASHFLNQNIFIFTIAESDRKEEIVNILEE